jgi:hypothetical protein
MNFSLLNRLVELETAVAHKTFAPEGERTFTYLPGHLPLLISAPHATIHQRHNRVKREEGFTGAMAHFLAETTGAHALYSRYRSPDDPNWNRHSPYKRFLQKVVQSHHVQFVIDLHGMSNRHNIGLALGSMNGRSCPMQEPIILQTITQHYDQTSETTANSLAALRWDYFVWNHSKFTGGLTNHTVTRFVSQQLGVAALQVELCAALRIVKKRPSGQPSQPYQGNPEPIVGTVTLLQNLICALASAL